MQVELTAVLPVEKETLRNLLEKYNYEFSQYDLIPFNEEGLYGYRYLDSYFTQPDRAAWFIRASRVYVFLTTLPISKMAWYFKSVPQSQT